MHPKVVLVRFTALDTAGDQSTPHTEHPIQCRARLHVTPLRLHVYAVLCVTHTFTDTLFPLVPITKTIWRRKVGTPKMCACNGAEPITSGPVTSIYCTLNFRSKAACHCVIYAFPCVCEFVRKMMLRDAADYGTWRAELKNILVAEDCWHIVNGTELEPDEIGTVVDLDEREENKTEEINSRQVEIKDWRKRWKKAAMLIVLSVDDSVVLRLEVNSRNPILMWAQLASDFNIVTPRQQFLAWRDFLNFSITEDETCPLIKHNFYELLRKVTAQGRMVTAADQLQTLLAALPEKFDMLRESCFAQTPLPNIEYIWTRMFDIEAIQKRRSARDEVTGMRARVYFQSRGRGGGSFRGRGRGGRWGIAGNEDFRAFGRGKGGDEYQDESCFRCGKSDHWSRECPSKDSVCGWCGAKGHSESRCNDKSDGHLRGRKLDGAKEAECTFAEYGHSEVL